MTQKEFWRKWKEAQDKYAAAQYKEQFKEQPPLSDTERKQWHKDVLNDAMVEDIASYFDPIYTVEMDYYHLRKEHKTPCENAFKRGRAGWQQIPDPACDYTDYGWWYYVRPRKTKTQSVYCVIYTSEGRRSDPHTVTKTVEGTEEDAYIAALKMANLTEFAHNSDDTTRKGYIDAYRRYLLHNAEEYSVVIHDVSKNKMVFSTLG